MFDLTPEHPFSNGIVFSDAEFAHLDQRPGTRLQRMGHFDFRTSSRSANAGGLVETPVCPSDDYASILP